MERWAALFADLEAELDAAEAAELDAEVRDRARREVARLHLADRLAPAVGHPVTVTTLGAGTVRGTLADAAPEWLLLAGDPAGECLVPARAVLGIGGLGAASTEPGTGGAARARLTLGYAVRALARARTPVAVTLLDGSALHGTLDRVGADFAELAEHPAGEARRPGLVRSVRTVPFAAIAAVRS
ncbi:MAG TPA: hypothetical protein VFQ85_16795 [Mycobacteriales bacterium]|nr:hypothetical protein [Mycobacteriales bacterium]